MLFKNRERKVGVMSGEKMNEIPVNNENITENVEVSDSAQENEQQVEDVQNKPSLLYVTVIKVYSDNSANMETIDDKTPPIPGPILGEIGRNLWESAIADRAVNKYIEATKKLMQNFQVKK
jgi:hypothetical protein